MRRRPAKAGSQFLKNYEFYSYLVALYGQLARFMQGALESKQSLSAGMSLLSSHRTGGRNSPRCRVIQEN